VDTGEESRRAGAYSAAIGGEAVRSHRMQLGGGTVARSDGIAAPLGKMREIGSNRRTTMGGAAAMVITFSPRLKAETGLKNEQRRLCARRLMAQSFQ
jgi:hypothetical protein